MNYKSWQRNDLAYRQNCSLKKSMGPMVFSQWNWYVLLLKYTLRIQLRTHDLDRVMYIQPVSPSTEPLLRCTILPTEPLDNTRYSLYSPLTRLGLPYFYFRTGLAHSLTPLSSPKTALVQD